MEARRIELPNLLHAIRVYGVHACLRRSTKSLYYKRFRISNSTAVRRNPINMSPQCPPKTAIINSVTKAPPLPRRAKTTQRRGWGEGSISYDPVRGRWDSTVDVERDPSTGRRRRIKVHGATKTEALQAARRARERAAAGIVPSASSVTVAEWLEHWLATVVDGRVNSDLTRANYAAMARTHLVPGLGAFRLDKLAPEHVDRFLAAKAAAGLSRSYISRMRTLLSDALRHAERRSLVTRNASALSVMPRTQPTKERRSLTAADVRRLLEAAKGERLEALLVVGLSVGLRPGELTGLLWREIDLDSNPPTLTVSGSMKMGPDGQVAGRGAVKRSAAGNRTLALPPMAADALRAHRKRQAAERLAVGEAWEDQGLVFASSVGTPLDPSNLRNVFKRVASKAGLDPGFPYLMRHTAVSLLLDAGKSIELVADMLGDDPRTLYRHYRHRVRPVADAGLAMQAVLEGTAP